MTHINCSNTGNKVIRMSAGEHSRAACISSRNVSRGDYPFHALRLRPEKKREAVLMPGIWKTKELRQRLRSNQPLPFVYRFGYRERAG